MKLIEEIASLLRNQCDWTEFESLGFAYTVNDIVRKRIEKAICENGGNYIVCDIMRAFDNE